MLNLGSGTLRSGGVPEPCCLYKVPLTNLVILLEWEYSRISRRLKYGLR
jgi:hypothetical protein